MELIPFETTILPQTPAFLKGKLEGSAAHGGIMNARKIVSAIAISAALLVGTTGCSLNKNVDSMMVYAPSDGSQLNIGNVKLRNFIYLSNGKVGGKLIGTVVNDTAKDISVQFEYIDFDLRTKTDPITISAGEALGLGSGSDTSGLGVTISGAPGSNVNIWVSVDGATGEQFVVPVLDGSLGQYAPFFQN